MKVKRLVPMLNVADIERSLTFYTDAAGFELLSPREDLERWRWAHIQTGQCELMLSQSGGPAAALAKGDPQQHESGWPVIFYFYPHDVVQLHTQLKQKDYPVGDLRVTFYGMKEFELRDPDGHILWFGQETDEPCTGGNVT